MFSATKHEGPWPFQSDMGMCLEFQWTLGSTGTPEMQVLLSKGPWSALSWWDSPASDTVLWCGQVPYKWFWTAWRGVCVVIRDSWKKRDEKGSSHGWISLSIYLFSYFYTAYMLIQAFSPYTMVAGFVCVSVAWIVRCICLLTFFSAWLLTFLFLILDVHNSVLCMFPFSSNFTFVWCHCFAAGIWFSTL